MSELAKNRLTQVTQLRTPSHLTKQNPLKENVKKGSNELSLCSLSGTRPRLRKSVYPWAEEKLGLLQIFRCHFG